MSNENIIVALITLVASYIVSQINGKYGMKVKTIEADTEKDRHEEEKRANTAAEWKQLYEVTAEERDELKKEYRELREVVYVLKDDQSKLKNDLDSVRRDFSDKENGYQIQIAKLKEELDDVKEENIALKEENKLLKGVKHGHVNK